MGHDISFYRLKPEQKQSEEDIGYIRFGAFNKFNSLPYVALDSMDCYGGVSGNGKERIFTKLEIETSIKRLEYLVGEENFIDTIVNDISDDNKRILEMLHTMFPVNVHKTDVDINKDIQFVINELKSVVSKMDDEDRVLIFFG
jgi:hypothetical protein